MRRSRTRRPAFVDSRLRVRAAIGVRAGASSWCELGWARGAAHLRKPWVRLRLKTLGWYVRHPLLLFAWIVSPAPSDSSHGSSRIRPAWRDSGVRISPVGAPDQMPLGSVAAQGGSHQLGRPASRARAGGWHRPQSGAAARRQGWEALRRPGRRRATRAAAAGLRRAGAAAGATTEPGRTWTAGGDARPCQGRAVPPRREEALSGRPTKASDEIQSCRNSYTYEYVPAVK